MVHRPVGRRLRRVQTAVERAGLLRSLVARFSEADAQAIKDIERTTNHDVKAVEYWIKGPLSNAELKAASEFVHFACTSGDINNTSHALMLKGRARRGAAAGAGPVVAKLGAMAHAWRRRRCSAARTARPPARPRWARRSPTWWRVAAPARRIAAVKLLAKMNGAVGNYNAHLRPGRVRLGGFAPVVEGPQAWAFNPYTIQIEPHDYMAELFDAVARANTILIDWSRDVWGYVSLGYFKQRTQGRRDRLVDHAAQGQPDRLRERRGQLRPGQRAARPPGARSCRSAAGSADLTDSTVLRNMGVALGHALLAITRCCAAGQAGDQPRALAADLDAAWEVLAEPIQTVMRRYGLPNPDERLKGPRAARRSRARRSPPSSHASNCPQAERRAQGADAGSYPAPRRRWPGAATGRRR